MRRGFTLIEILVGIMIFIIVVEITLGIFISGIRDQRRALASQTLLDQTSYALEYMSRALRLASKELSAPACLSQNGLNYEIPPEYRIGGNENLGTGLRFMNHLENDECQEFFLQSGQLKYRKKIGETPLNLTSDKLEITSLKFNLAGKSQNDNLQPVLTIFLQITRRELFEGRPEIKIQTTISQRNLDVLY